MCLWAVVIIVRAPRLLRLTLIYRVALKLGGLDGFAPLARLTHGVHRAVVSIFSTISSRMLV